MNMKLVTFILIIELSILLSCFLSLIFVRLWRNWKNRKLEQRRKLLKKMFAKALEKHEVLHIDQIDPALVHYEDLLATAETFDRFFLDSTWQETKQQLIDSYLGKKARMLAKSFNFKDRLLGLRCIALKPKELMDKQVVVPLLNDSKFMVRILAASSLIHIGQKDLLLAVLKRMVQESSMTRYAYRDLLINAGDITFQLIGEIADQENDPELIAICLDVLSTKWSYNVLPLAIKYINSKDLVCKLAAIEIFSKIPGNESKEHLSESLLDENWKVRAKAASGLGQIRATASILNLERTLQDPKWLVRLQAAAALKRMGKEGIDVLYRQNPQNAESYEIAKYILALP